MNCLKCIDIVIKLAILAMIVFFDYWGTSYNGGIWTMGQSIGFTAFVVAIFGFGEIMK